ncbi:MAG: hypothetical protein GOMPHAMPRED_004546 [Gomphillus americanus]|uniref:Uncharacterized protein n=1 Tax=Gomphillus americanus TaxID=1940652 RepID=A0A8H3FQ51_9LECA|nr:MAG: hypothetical protein GOMPHAMPRED_004546 [Gomphillus americanus]
MKLLAFFAAIASAASFVNSQTILAGNPQLPYQPYHHFSILSRAATSAHTLLPRGLRSKLTSCFGSLCGGRSTTSSDQSTRGSGYTQTPTADTITRDPSMDHGPAQPFSFRPPHSALQNISPRPQAIPSAPRIFRSSTDTPTTPTHPQPIPGTSRVFRPAAVRPASSGLSQSSDTLQGSASHHQVVAGRRGSLNRVWSRPTSPPRPPPGQRLHVYRGSIPPSLRPVSSRRAGVPLIRAHRPSETSVTEIHLPEEVGSSSSSGGPHAE